MYQINDMIIYGKIGVCKVDKIGIPAISGIDQKKQYYMLTPMDSRGSAIYTPVNNSKVSMRKIITHEEAQELIDNISSIPIIENGNDKFMEEKYRNALSSQDCEALIKVIKTVYIKEQDKISEGKKLGQIDERYKKLAEDLLYGELAIVLQKPKEKMKAYIEHRIIQIEQNKHISNIELCR